MTKDEECAMIKKKIFKFQFIGQFAPFLFRQERCPKEADIGEALRANAPSPMYLTRRIAIQHSKMFRFLNACILQSCKFVPQSPLKIGTFSVGGGLCGGSGVRGEVVLRAANLNRPLAGGKRSTISAIGSECLAPDDFFGYFLVRTQESNTYQLIDKLQFGSLKKDRIFAES